MVEQAVNTDLPTDEHGRLLDHVACVSCGYDLYGVPSGGHCPECGEAVSLTVRADSLRYCDSRWVKKLADGLGWMGYSVLLGFVIGFMTGCVIGAASAGGAVNQSAVMLAQSVIALGVLVGFGWGVWQLTAPEPQIDPAEQPGSRRGVRIGVMLVIVLAAMGAAVGGLSAANSPTGQPSSTMLNVLSIPGNVVNAVVAVLLGYYLRHLAERAAMPAMGVQAVVVGYLAAVINVLALVTVGLQLVGLVQPPSPGGGGAGPALSGGMVVMGLVGCLLILVFVVALVWGLIVIFQLRGRFAREAQQGAAMQQAAAQPPQPTAEPWHQG